VDKYQFDAVTRADLSRIEQTYKTELTQDDALDTAYRQMVAAFANVDNDPNLDAPAKQRAKYDQARVFENYARVRGLSLDLDFSSNYASDPSDASSETTTTAAANPSVSGLMWTPDGGN